VKIHYDSPYAQKHSKAFAYTTQQGIKGQMDKESFLDDIIDWLHNFHHIKSTVSLKPLLFGKK